MTVNSQTTDNVIIADVKETVKERLPKGLEPLKLEAYNNACNIDIPKEPYTGLNPSEQWRQLYEPDALFGSKVLGFGRRFENIFNVEVYVTVAMNLHAFMLQKYSE